MAETQLLVAIGSCGDREAFQNPKTARLFRTMLDDALEDYGEMPMPGAAYLFTPYMMADEPRLSAEVKDPPETLAAYLSSPYELSGGLHVRSERYIGDYGQGPSQEVTFCHYANNGEQFLYTDEPFLDADGDEALSGGTIDEEHWPTLQRMMHIAYVSIGVIN